MEKYFINYHTGAGNEIIEVNDLDEAKEIAFDGIAYTQSDITIETLEGEVITKAKWWGVIPDEDVADEDVLTTIGNGYYQVWSDEYE